MVHVHKGDDIHRDAKSRDKYFIVHRAHFGSGCDLLRNQDLRPRQHAGRRHKMRKSHCACYRKVAIQAGYRWNKIAMTFSRTTVATAAFVIALISVSSGALAQGAPPAKKPTVRGKPIFQAKPSAPIGCKLVGTVKGTKIWAGNCLDASELRGTTPADEVPSPPPPVAAPPEKE